MSYLSAGDDLQNITLSALKNDLARLRYLASLRTSGRPGYLHWGFEQRHGSHAQSSFEKVHQQVFFTVLKTRVEAVFESWRAEAQEPDGVRLDDERIFPAGIDPLYRDQFILLMATCESLATSRKRKADG